jgi:hypothetical protein
MSMYDDRDTAISRDPAAPGTAYQAAPPQQQPYGYGYRYGRPYGLGMRPGWSETKPFFMTSEFLGTLVTILAIAITAAVAEDLDSRGACLLIAILVAAYTVSRGIAKAGTRSRAVDPRDELDLRRSHGDGAR